MTDKPYSRCLIKPGTLELHPCPYLSCINEDDSQQCNCCDDCVQECAEDI
jgi:hypothetical protein